MWSVKTRTTKRLILSIAIRGGGSDFQEHLYYLVAVSCATFCALRLWVDQHFVVPLFCLTLATALACWCKNSSLAASRAASRATASSSETRLSSCRIAENTCASVIGQPRPIAWRYSSGAGNVVSTISATALEHLPLFPVLTVPCIKEVRARNATSQTPPPGFVLFTCAVLFATRPRLCSKLTYTTPAPAASFPHFPGDELLGCLILT